MILLWACQTPVVDQPLTEPRVVALPQNPQVAADEPIIVELRGEAPPQWTISPGAPTSDELTINLSEEGLPTSDGVRSSVSHHYTLGGEPGSYIVHFTPGQATDPDGSSIEVQAAPLFVDIGVEGPTGGPMADLVAAPPPAPPPWGLIAGIGAGILALGLATFALVKRTRVVPPPPEPDPPHVAARKAWDRARLTDDEHAQALQLSWVLREYLEAILGWPATARTTREILLHLEAIGGMDHTHRGHAQHILDATDRLKFAREGGGQGFFESLDADFRNILRHTEPRDVGVG